MIGAAMGAAKGIIGGLTGIAGGIIGGGKRKREQREAQNEFNTNKARYENLDTTNLAANSQNAFEDLTVNTQAADFAGQQQQQALSNTMGTMQGAAGGSGIAALAQAMAGQQSQNLQQASASIGQQESQNAMKAAQGDMTVQSMELQGAQQSRAAELDKTETLLGMSQQRLGAANQARDKATQSLVSGVGSFAGGVGAAAAAGGKMDGGGDGFLTDVTKGLGF
jgi:hypothetical protein|tara:strand:+ start:9108 stop:9776 length:669 start_codon:yes stop_codon:yes gene_type:complete